MSSNRDAGWEAMMAQQHASDAVLKRQHILMANWAEDNRRNVRMEMPVCHHPIGAPCPGGNIPRWNNPWVQGAGSQYMIPPQVNQQELRMRSRLRDLRLLRSTPAYFQLPQYIPDPDSDEEEVDVEIEVCASPLKPLKEFLEMEKKRFEKGKGVIEKMSQRLVEECDIIRIALFLTFGEPDYIN